MILIIHIKKKEHYQITVILTKPISSKMIKIKIRFILEMRKMQIQLVIMIIMHTVMITTLKARYHQELNTVMETRNTPA